MWKTWKKQPWCPGKCPGKCGISRASAGCTHIVCSGFLPTKLCQYIPQVLRKFCIFPGSFMQTPAFFFSGFSTDPWDMYCIFTCVWHVYSGHLPTKLFVYILQMLWKSCICPWSFTQTPGLCVSGFPHFF